LALTYVARKTVRDCLVMIFLLSNDRTLLQKRLEVVVSFGNANLQIYIFVLYQLYGLKDRQQVFSRLD
jgi:hypothetical protein